MTSSKPIHLLIPMSGQGRRYRAAGYTEPKPLIPVNGVPMIERLLSNFPAHWPTTFVLAENHRETQLEATLKRNRPQAQIIYIPEHSKGPSYAALAGLEKIPTDAPVFLSYCDYAMVWDNAQFERFVRDSNCDACLVSYRGFHAHYLGATNYAFSRQDGERVVEIREKGNFTSNRENEFASCGAYYFGSAEILREAIEVQSKAGMQLGGEFYTSLTVEALLKSKPDAHVRVFEIPYFFQWGTPEDLRIFEYWEKTFKAANRLVGQPRGKVDQVLMPMAGLGSRFKDISNKSKPFIPVDGVPMFLRAAGSLPEAKTTAFVLHKGLAADFAEAFPAANKDSSTKSVVLSETPPGQALSTEAGVRLIGKGDVVVSSCDHGIVLDPKKWDEFRRSPDCGAAIFAVRGFPGTIRRPEAFAYIETKGEGTFPEVAAVSVKKPLSATPQKDWLLVGTFWFKDAQVLQGGIDKLKAANVRVNGELYLDSVFDILRAGGTKVRIIPLEGYINWGDPDSLAEALYWQEVFFCRSTAYRPRLPGMGKS